MTDSGSDGVLEAGDLDVVLPIVTLGLLGFAASVLVLGAALLIARAIYLNSVPASHPHSQARHHTLRVGKYWGVR